MEIQHHKDQKYTGTQTRELINQGRSKPDPVNLHCAVSAIMSGGTPANVLKDRIGTGWEGEHHLLGVI